MNKFIIIIANIFICNAAFSQVRTIDFIYKGPCDKPIRALHLTDDSTISNSRTLLVSTIKVKSRTFEFIRDDIANHKVKQYPPFLLVRIKEGEFSDSTIMDEQNAIYYLRNMKMSISKKKNNIDLTDINEIVSYVSYLFMRIGRDLNGESIKQNPLPKAHLK